MWKNWAWIARNSDTKELRNNGECENGNKIAGKNWKRLTQKWDEWRTREKERCSVVGVSDNDDVQMEINLNVYSYFVQSWTGR